MPPNTPIQLSPQNHPLSHQELLKKLQELENQHIEAPDLSSFINFQHSACLCLSPPWKRKPQKPSKPSKPIMEQMSQQITAQIGAVINTISKMHSKIKKQILKLD